MGFFGKLIQKGYIEDLENDLTDKMKSNEAYNDEVKFLRALLLDLQKSAEADKERLAEENRALKAESLYWRNKCLNEKKGNK